MTYQSFLSNNLIRLFKSQTHKKHIIQNIEKIGQRKIVIIGDSYESDLFTKELKQLRKKGVKVPPILFYATNDQRQTEGDSEKRFITHLEGRKKSVYVCVVSAYTPFEKMLRGKAGLLGDSFTIEERLKSYGYTTDDYCLVNQPFPLLSAQTAIMKLISDFSESRQRSKSIRKAKKTESQLEKYKNKHQGQRCFIIGYKKNVKIDEVNIMMNEFTFSYNGICNLFSRTPQRPTYYLLSHPDHYLGNGKYIEGMETFITSRVKVFEEKFIKKPTFINELGNGLIHGLEPFSALNENYVLQRIDDLYISLQLAMFMGFKEIYIYGFDGIYSAQINEFNEATTNSEEDYVYPEKAKEFLSTIKAYALRWDIKIYNLNGGESLDIFEKADFSQLDFSQATLLPRK